MESSLRIATWNVLAQYLWDHWRFPSPGRHDISRKNNIVQAIARRVWLSHLVRDKDALPVFKTAVNTGVYYSFKEYFMKTEWFHAYDFVEFLLQDVDARQYLDGEFTVALNNVLKKDNAAYRVVGDQIAEVTSEEEIASIEAALEHPDTPVREHIRAALTMLSNRENPDYRNSVKESISAVEAMCRILTGQSSVTLGDALKKIPNLHEAMKKAFLALYGFTSDASGVRHSLMNESNITYTDAKFMLSCCSSFVSYLRASTITS